MWLNANESFPLSRVVVSFGMMFPMVVEVQVAVWVSRKLGLRDGRRLGRSVMEAHIAAL